MKKILFLVVMLFTFTTYSQVGGTAGKYLIKPISYYDNLPPANTHVPGVELPTPQQKPAQPIHIKQVEKPDVIVGTYEDKAGKVYTLYMTPQNKYYYLKTSQKTGNLYRVYVKVEEEEGNIE